MDKPKISIIIPVYNTSKHLAKCIISVINQTYRNLEIILINDGSTDNSLDICNLFAKEDNRIIVVDKPNGGVSFARNCGLDVATGEYIGFIDSDDYIHLLMYEKLIEVILETKSDIAECGYCTTDMNYTVTKIIDLERTITEGNYQCSYDYLMGKNSKNYNWNKLYIKDLFNDVRYPNLECSEDFVVNVKTFYKCRRKVTIEGNYYYYVINEKSVCNRTFSVLSMDEIKAGKEMYNFHQAHFPDLCPFIALYIVNYVMKFYYELRYSNEINKKEYYKKLIKDFKEFYPHIKGNALKTITLKKRLLMRTFYFSPHRYCDFYNILKGK